MKRWIPVMAMLILLGCDTVPQKLPGFSGYSFEPGEATPVATDRVVAEGDHWRVSADSAQSVRLFELHPKGLNASRLAFVAEAKAIEVYGTAHLEMWVNFPGKGEFFSKALDTPLTGNLEWSHYSAPFVLPGDLQPDRIRLQLTFADRGTVLLRDVRVEVTK